MTAADYALREEGNKLSERIEEELADLDRDYIVLILASARDYHRANIELLRYMVHTKRSPGVYVTINKPFSTMKKILEKENIDTRMMIFIDAITKPAGGQAEKVENCLYLGSPENLTDISVAMTEATRSIPAEQKFVFFDSLTTLLLYNNMGTVARFAHFLTGKMRSWGVEGFLISVEKETDEAFISQLSQFCDKVIVFGMEEY
jgi:KaiC/GvpD/RAD55 family RecA-like ATPase